MSSLASTADLPLPLTVRRRELLLGALATAAFAGLVIAIGPAPGDAPVHLYRTLLVRHGTYIWDNFWYDGSYPLASYSVLYYLPAALLGNLPFVFAASVLSTMLFASIALREWGRAALWPTRAFGVLAAAPMFTGLYAYSLGFTAMLGALKALQTGRRWLAVLLAVITVGFSPLAFAFLVLVLAALAVSRRRFSRQTLVIGGGLALSAGIELGVLTLFPTNTGVYPFHWVDFVAVIGVCVLGALIARRSRAAAPLLAFYALWGLGSVVMFIVPTPLGDNWTRLSAFAFPLTLLTAALASWQPRKLVVLALAGSLAYNIVPYLLLVPYRLDNRPASVSFWAPALDYLKQHATPGYRIEVVPTAAHWEAYWVPKAGFPLARGWYRQLDVVDNPALYAKHLDASSYRRWLRSSAVEYVLLASTPLDWDGGPQEAKIVQSAASGLKVVFRSANWTIYRLPHPTPLFTGPGKPVVTDFAHTVIKGSVSQPGRYLLRAHYNPFWQVSGGCATRAPGSMTWIELKSAGPFSLSVPATPEALVGAIFAKKHHC